MNSPDPSDTIAVLSPSRGRRWVGVVAACLAGGLLVAVSLFRPPDALAAQVFLFLAGAALLWQAQWNLRVTQTGLVLTRQGLFDNHNTMICALSNMQEVDRGVFALRPSNGFLIRLWEPEPRGWAPGLYWRLGKRLGIGGATQPAQTKALAEAIEVLLMERTLGVE